jgi:hypothetical protein
VISNELLGRNLDFPWFSMVFLLEWTNSLLLNIA